MAADQASDKQPITRADEAEEVTISPALRQRLQKCFDRGSSLVSQEDYDFDYADTMFGECAIQDPGNLIYVDAFLSNLQRKYKNNKKGIEKHNKGKKIGSSKRSGISKVIINLLTLPNLHLLKLKNLYMMFILDSYMIHKQVNRLRM